MACAALPPFWVLIGHAMILSGWGLPIISRPDYGVDLFILLSGFLMVFHYELRRAKEPWECPTTWRTFWVRRFFRIAPLYYLALALALIAGPHIGHARAEIASVLPQTATPAARYFDRSLDNVIAHVTFVFGQIPHYAFRTSLPDWSIGLEMAFYLAFPFLMLAAKRVSMPFAAIAFTALSFGIVKIFHVYTAGFDEPAFLPLKLNIFFSGMLIAGALTRSALFAAPFWL
jgi:peptidoglycan/LPS O-acetylase OafA/YrhL